jgi:hypothetical protein
VVAGLAWGRPRSSSATRSPVSTQQKGAEGKEGILRTGRRGFGGSAVGTWPPSSPAAVWGRGCAGGEAGSVCGRRRHVWVWSWV